MTTSICMCLPVFTHVHVQWCQSSIVRPQPGARPGTVGGMRWERLFAELEAEAAELSERRRDAEIADRTRAELARTHWLDRVRASTGTTVRLRLLGAEL